MLVLMDPFAEAVEEARLRLSRKEGQTVSIRELARRAGVAESTLNYNLSGDRPRRRVKAELVEALERVLPVEAGELMRAAQVAAGYQVREPEFPDLGAAVTRFLSDRHVPESEKRQLRSRLADILAEEMRKAAESRNGK